MPPVRIVPYQPKHKILRIPALMQLIQDFLQYEDQLTTYIYFRTLPPIMPIDSISAAAIYDPKHKYDQITDWYVPYDEHLPLTREYLEFKTDFDDVTIHLQCGYCLEYISLEPRIDKVEMHRDGELESSFTETLFPMFIYRMPGLDGIFYLLCECAIKHMSGSYYKAYGSGIQVKEALKNSHRRPKQVGI